MQRMQTILLYDTPLCLFPTSGPQRRPICRIIFPALSSATRWAINPEYPAGEIRHALGLPNVCIGWIEPVAAPANG